MLISHTKSWCGICDKIVIPLLRGKLGVENISNISASSFDLKTLEAKTFAVDIYP